MMEPSTTTGARWDEAGSDVPPGWTYNPSTWPQRLPIVGLALAGFAIAGYLGLFQLGVVAGVWEPLFGDGSEVILTSKLSHVLPIPDAVLGALAYLADAVAGVAGGKGRWRRWPWLTVVFGVLVGPLGGVSVALAVAQPVMYGTWCTLCLVTAVISMLMIGPAMDEVLASLQHLRRVADDPERSAWRAFWGLEGA